MSERDVSGTATSAGSLTGYGVQAASAAGFGVEWIFGLEDRLMTWSSELKLYRIRPTDTATGLQQQSLDSIGMAAGEKKHYLYQQGQFNTYIWLM